MKKLFGILASLLLIIGISACTCSSEKKVQGNDVLRSSEAATVENLISLDRQAMFVAHGGDYRWYETGVQLKNWLDEENDGAIDLVVNVFQVIEQYDSTSFDTFVYKYQHVGEDVFEEAGWSC